MDSDASPTVVISLDAELAWGFHDRYPLSESDRRQVSNARRSWRRLIGLFDEHSIPATWAVVGELLVNDERLRDAHPHTDEWFETYRHEVTEHPEQWFANDLVRAIATAETDHEIASHSFSHVVFSEASSEAAEAECRFAQAAAGRRDRRFASFVFPRNEIEHRRALAENGYICYRGRRPTRLPALPGVRGAATLAGAVFGAPAPPVVTPRIDEYGLVELPASLFLGGFDGPLWAGVTRVGDDPAVRLVKRIVERAQETNGIAHLWLHPNDLVYRSDVRRMEAILSYLGEQRDRGSLTVETMEQVARRVLASSGPGAD